MNQQPQFNSPFRSLATTTERIKQTAVKHVVSQLIRQYGIDDLLRGFAATYRENVFSRAKSSEPVKHRVALLDEMVDRLQLEVILETVRGD